MAIHSSILAWRIPWTEGPRRLQSALAKELDTTERLNSNTFHFISMVPLGKTFSQVGGSTDFGTGLLSRYKRQRNGICDREKSCLTIRICSSILRK